MDASAAGDRMYVCTWQVMDVTYTGRADETVNLLDEDWGPRWIAGQDIAVNMLTAIYRVHISC